MSSERINVLVLGPARSGTTLLASIIGFHPDVRMMSECTSHEYRQQIGGRVVGNKLCVPNHIFLESDGPQLPRPVSPKSFLARTADVARWLVGHQRPAPKSIRDYVEDWKAKVVLIVRNPDHVVHSIHRRGGETTEIARYRWAEALLTIDKLVQDYPENTFLIEFEDLVTQPRSVTQRICDFIGIEFSEQMLNGYQGTRQYDRDRIDPSVATKSVQDAHIEQYYPEALKVYSQLTGRREEPPQNVNGVHS